MLLDTANPGNIGLTIDADTVLFVRGNHARAHLIDESGHVEDLRAQAPDFVYCDGAGFTTAAVLRWEDLKATDRRGVDRSGRSRVLTRDLSVQWIGQVEPTAGVDGVVVGRGLGGTAGERKSWEVSIDTDFAYPQIVVNVNWETVAGVSAGVSITLPASAPTGTTLWTITRRWESATVVVVRVYAGRELLAEDTSADGAIGGSTVATTRMHAGNGYQGTLDQLRVVAREISAEEVRETWERLTVHQPAGEAAFRALSPPGIGWYRGDTVPAKFARVIGQALGFAAAAGHALRATFLPAWASRDTIARWERLTGASPGTIDSLDRRRSRVVDLLSRDNGYAPPNVRELLAESFDQDAADVEIVEFGPDVQDAFATIDTRRWLVEPGNATSWTAASGARLQAAAAADLRLAIGEIHGATLEMCVEAAPDSYDACSIRFDSGAAANLPVDAEAGILLRHGSRGDRFFFGIRRVDAVEVEVRYERWRDGVQLDTSAVVGSMGVTVSTVMTYWLRVRIDPDEVGFGAGNDLRLQVEWSADGTTWNTEAGIVWCRDWQWAGFYVRSDDASVSAAVDVLFAAHHHREAQGYRCLRWYAYRDLGLGGNPDLELARTLVAGVKPAHTYATAVVELDVLCDDGNAGCERAPLGPVA